VLGEARAGLGLQRRKLDRWGKLELRYEADDTPPFDKVPWAPIADRDLSALRVRVTKIATFNSAWEPEKTWKAFAESFASQIITKGSGDLGLVQKRAREVAAGAQGERAKIEAIVDYVARMIEVDEKAERRSFTKLLRGGRGQSWRITALAREMLRAVGIKAHYVLIQIANQDRFDDEFISEAQLGESALAVWIDGKRHIVLPYVRYLQPGLLPPAYQERRALLFDAKQGARLITTPEHDSSKAQIDQELELELHPKTKRVCISERTRYQGLWARPILALLDGLGADALRRTLSAHRQYRDGAIDSFSGRVQRSGLSSVTVKASYCTDNLMTVRPGVLVISTAGLLGPVSRWRSRADKHRRRQVVLDTNTRTTARLRLRLPAGWTYRGCLPASRHTTRFITVEHRAKLRSGSLELSSTITKTRHSMPAGDAAKVLAMARRANTNPMPTVVLERAGSSSQPTSMPSTTCGK